MDLTHITVIHNKTDVNHISHHISNHISTEVVEDQSTLIKLSAKTGDGIDLLRQHLKACMGYSGAGEGGFTARRRHINALEKAQQDLNMGQTQLNDLGAGELLAEDLRLCQNALSEITGEFTPDDLLGEIFSSFCIGK